MKKIPELEDVRRDLDKVDSQIIGLLAKRKNLVEQVTSIKLKYELTANQPARFKKLVRVLQGKAKELDLDPNFIVEVWNAIHKDSKKQQNKKLRT